MAEDKIIEDAAAEATQAADAALDTAEAKAPAATEGATPQYKPLSTGIKYFYGVGDFGFNLMSSVETYYFVFFLTNFALFDAATAAWISGVGSTIDAILGWMYGGFINSLPQMRWGRYRSYLILTTWLVPIFFALEFTRISENTMVAAIFIIAMNIISHAAWDFPYVANVSMIPIAAHTPEDRTRMAATRGMWSNAAKIFFSYLCPPVALAGASILGQTNQYAFAAFIFGLIMAVMYAVHFKMFKGYEKEYTKEELKALNAQKARNVQDRTTFADLGRALITNPPLIFLLLADIAKWVFNFMCAGFASYFFIYVVFSPGLTATYIFISNILCVIGSYVSAPIARAVKSSRNAAILAYILMAACLFIASMQSANAWFVVIMMSIAQGFYGITYSCSSAMYADCVVYAEWKTRKNAAGWISGLQLFPLKIGFVARGVAIPAVLAAFGWAADYATTYNEGGIEAIQGGYIPDLLQQGIVTGFCLIPAVLLIVAAVLLLVGFRLTPAKMKEYQAEIDARVAAGEVSA